ncbi:MAG: response regulator [Sumerlaeia bacterium]
MCAKILIVDDEPDVRELLKLTLKPQHTVVEARHGKAAWQMLEQDALRPDVILTDLVMPRMDGLTLTEHIKSTDWGSETLVIILTGAVAGENIPSHVWKVGTPADHFLEKPFEPLKLLKLIDDYMKQKIGFTPLESGTGTNNDDPQE